MNRGLLVGAIAFIAAFAAERLFTSLGPDISRYNRIREMSGQGPLFKEILSFGGQLLGDGGINRIVDETTQDVVRYARMKGM